MKWHHRPPWTYLSLYPTSCSRIKKISELCVCESFSVGGGTRLMLFLPLVPAAASPLTMDPVSPLCICSSHGWLCLRVISVWDSSAAGAQRSSRRPGWETHAVISILRGSAAPWGPCQSAAEAPKVRFGWVQEPGPPRPVRDNPCSSAARPPGVFQPYQSRCSQADSRSEFTSWSDVLEAPGWAENVFTTETGENGQRGTEEPGQVHNHRVHFTVQQHRFMSVINQTGSLRNPIKHPSSWEFGAGNFVSPKNPV